MAPDDRQAPASAPADSSGLGAAIEALIQKRVNEALAREREQRPPPRVQQLVRQFDKAPVTDFKQPPPVTKPKPTFNTIFHRDSVGRILWSETLNEQSGERFITEVAGRDGLGAIVGLRTLPPHESRDYKQPGKPR